jgi:uncharacterized protein (DUF488 family)
MRLFTIGHSVHSLDKFVHLLDENGIMTLVDVRTAPASRYQPQFNKANLEQLLPQHAIQYVFAGKYLGGRPSDPTCYKKRILPAEGADYLHEVDYPEVMNRTWFVKGIQRLLELADEQTAAIMCSEEDPALCHRHHLIAQYILHHCPEVSVQHIRGNGIVFSAASLLVSVDAPLAEQPSLFE